MIFFFFSSVSKMILFLLYWDLSNGIFFLRYSRDPCHPYVQFYIKLQDSRSSFIFPRFPIFMFSFFFFYSTFAAWVILHFRLSLVEWTLTMCSVAPWCVDIGEHMTGQKDEKIGKLLWNSRCVVSDENGMVFGITIQNVKYKKWKLRFDHDK